MCIVKACPYPEVRDGFCRTHLEDQVADHSVIPSTMILLESNPVGFKRSAWDEYLLTARE